MTRSSISGRLAIALGVMTAAVAAGSIVLSLPRARGPHPLYGADSTVSALTSIGTLHSDDLLMDVDVHDQTMASTGTNKKLTVSQLVGSATTGQMVGISTAGVPVGYTVGSGLSVNTSTNTLSATGSGSGTVTSVGLTVPSGLTVTGSPVTTSGTLAIGGTLAASAGGTGVNGASASNGQLLIGNGSGYSLANLTAGANVTITNSSGGITIASSGGSAGAGGSSGQIQYNNGGSLAGLANLTVSSNSLANLTSVSDPATAAAGDLWLSSSSGGLSFASASGWPARLPRRIYSGGGFAAVANTASWTSALTSPTYADGSLTIPANALKQGAIIEIWPMFTWGTASSAPTGQFRVTLGGTVVLQQWNYTTLATSQTNQAGFVLSPLRLYVVAAGASGSVYGSGYVCYLASSGASNQGMSTGTTGASSPVTINTTGSLALDCQFQWSAASASNTLTMQAFEVMVR